ncbi:zonadhesin-like [Culex pipiens pallens]|uniref:zonadhesin-like n=1 Tax=Culex pipiens pallens TaxID=42434 RepID=UPI0019544F87|nr:zonadhesin-like [Culex pipiens pallens]
MRLIAAGLLLFGTLAPTLAIPPPTKPPCCPRHEVFTECGSSCPATCNSILERNANRVCPDICVRGCVCREGFVRNRDGKCIPPDRCGRDGHRPGDSSEEESGIRCHRPNEVFSECGSACPETCDSIAKGGSERKICTKNCVIGCTCREGYVRNADGECVLPEECPRHESAEESTKCGCNEEFNRCGSACPETCDILLGVAPRKPCIKICVEGCFCKEGFVRNQDGKCVPASECSVPEPVCPPNEIFKTCGTACPETCDTIREPNATRICTFQCVIGCACQDGFVRNHDGRCVLPSECPDLPEESSLIMPECAPNEVFSECGTACPDTCANLDDPKPRPCTRNCVIGCICQEGFVRNDEGQCVLPSQCPNSDAIASSSLLLAPLPECGPNELYNECGTACPETCDTFNGLVENRACILLCVPGCFCKDGFVRNKDGQCIPPSECPNPTGSTPTIEIVTPVCGKNEIFSKCGTACPTTCDTILGLTDNRICPTICRIGCVCQNGFVRNQSGQCVAPSECPGVSTPEPITTPKCASNEVYSQCGSACPATCETISGRTLPRVCPAVCIRGCVCRAGYVRNAAGKCVLPYECESSPECGPQEVYRECGSACPPTCRNVLNPNLEIACIDKCVAGCFCRDGLVRHHNGKCVSPKQCRIPIGIFTVGSSEELSAE